MQRIRIQCVFVILSSVVLVAGCTSDPDTVETDQIPMEPVAQSATIEHVTPQLKSKEDTGMSDAAEATPSRYNQLTDKESYVIHGGRKPPGGRD